MKTDADRLVEDYLDRLESALDDVPRARRRELVQEIASHIDEGLAEANGEADVRNLLDRMGEPAEIAAEARERIETDAPAPQPQSRTLEIWALVMLSVGSLILPVLGWLVGVILLWSSRIWTTGEKLAGTLLVPGGLVLPAYVILGAPLASSEICTFTSDSQGNETGDCVGGWSGTEEALAIALFFILLVVPLLMIVHLARRMNQRTAA